MSTLIDVAKQMRVSLGDLLCAVEKLESLPNGRQPTGKPAWIDLVPELPTRRSGFTDPWFAANKLTFWWLRDARQAVDGITIHHAGSLASSPQSIANYCVNSKKLPSVQYHYMVWQNGTIYRTADDNWALWHDQCGGFNKHTSVMLNGNFLTIDIPAAQLAAAAQLTSWLMSEYDILTDRVKGHNEWSRVCTGKTQTECPGWAKFKDTFFAQLAPVVSFAPTISFPFDPKNENLGRGEEEE